MRTESPHTPDQEPLDGGLSEIEEHGGLSGNEKGTVSWRTQGRSPPVVMRGIPLSAWLGSWRSEGNGGGRHSRRTQDERGWSG